MYRCTMSILSRIVHEHYCFCSSIRLMMWYLFSTIVYLCWVHSNSHRLERPHPNVLILTQPVSRLEFVCCSFEAMASWLVDILGHQRKLWIVFELVQFMFEFRAQNDHENVEVAGRRQTENTDLLLNGWQTSPIYLLGTGRCMIFWPLFV